MRNIGINIPRLMQVFNILLGIKENKKYLITAPIVPTPCVHARYANRVYAFSAPTTRLRVWYTYEALTHQGEVSSDC